MSSLVQFETDVLIVLSWQAWSSAELSSKRRFVPLRTSKTSLVFWTAAVWPRSAFWDICRWGSSYHSCWTTNRLQQKRGFFVMKECTDLQFSRFCCWCWDFRFILRIWESTNAQRQWSSRTWEQLSTVDVCSEVVVSVGRGKRKTRLFGRHYFLLTAGWSLLLQVETELLLLSRKLESITSRLLLLLLSLPIRELHLQDVLALFWEGVDVLQAQPELTWRTTTIRLILRSSDADCKEFFQLLLLVLTVQAAEASLVALPKLVEVLGSIETFLDDGPSTFCGESRGKRLS